MSDKSMTTPVSKYLQHQSLLGSGATTIHLVPTDYVQETSSGISNEMASITPEFEGKLKCINYMCARVKLDTRNDSVNIRYSAKA
jgi:hypothetical protein